MSVSDKIQALEASRQAIATAITQKGGTVAQGDGFSQFATEISNLPSGGSGNPLLTSIDVSDFTGTTFDDAKSYITNVTIPSGVTIIGESAFLNASRLTSITIPNSVTSIRAQAFESCTGLTSITIPNGVTSIGFRSFYNCTGLIGTFTIPDTVTSLANNAFYQCNHVTSFIVGSGINSIGIGVFQNCTSLTSVTVNATTPPTLGNGTFTNTNNCPIYVPAASVNTYKAASGWSSYASRIYPIQQVATVDGNPVYNYDLGMTSTDSITSENMAKMPAGTSLELAEGITWAGGATAFSNYTNLTLPSTFATFGDQDMLNGLTVVTSKATTPPTAERNQIGGSSLTAIYVPASAVDTYKAHAAWSGFASIIQAIPTE